MSSELTIAGDVTSALTYFAAVGTALIVEEELHQTAYIEYSLDSPPKAKVRIGSASTREVAEAIQSVATRWASEGSWATSTHEYPEKKSSIERSPFSPRIKQFSDETVRECHVGFRTFHLDHAREQGDTLMLSLVAGLGEAAYWRTERNQPRPDDGASRWEMKTRNKGQEFIKDRLALLVCEDATWEIEEILDGVIGTQVKDALGGNKDDSRSATGFATPGPADNALALLALLGISAFPVSLQSKKQSVTPGAFPIGFTHPQFAVFPVPNRAVTLSSLKTAIVSSQLDSVAREMLGFEGDSEQSVLAAAGKTWLRDRGFGAVVCHQILKTGSSSAPERQILEGNLVPL